MSGYRGRFAPSPTGPLHFGSLVAAAGSYLDARAHRGSWLVRMEDIDAPRCVAGALAGILRTLERYGFVWDEPVVYQSSRAELYEAALQQLREDGRLNSCSCPRWLAQGRCLGNCSGGAALRLRVEPGFVRYTDRFCGPQSQDVASEVGDFVLKRSDGLYAYQLAVVVDDAAQGFTDIVRGADLLDSTPRQIMLQRALGLPQPRYLHLPVAVNEKGQKLSKQTRAPSISRAPVVETLWQALAFLQQQPPDELRLATAAELWAWAIERWRANHVIS